MSGPDDMGWLWAAGADGLNSEGPRREVDH